MKICKVRTINLSKNARFKWFFEFVFLIFYVRVNFGYFQTSKTSFLIKRTVSNFAPLYLLLLISVNIHSFFSQYFKKGSSCTVVFSDNTTEFFVSLLQLS